MAKTAVADIIIPTEFEKYAIERTAELSAFGQCGIIEHAPEFDELASGGGREVKMPFWKDLTAARQLLADNASLAVNKIGSDQDIARIHNDAQVWSVNHLAKVISGDDPLQAIVDLVGDYWARTDEGLLVSCLKGIFAAGSMAGNRLAIASETVAGQSALTRLNGATFVDATVKLGDRGDRLTAVAMHSATEAALRKLDLIDFIPDSEGKAQIKTFQGRRVVVDDNLPVRNGTTDGQVYTTYLFGPGAFGKGSAALSSEPLQGGHGTEGVELARVPLDSDTVLINRRRYILHPRGVKFTSAAVVGDSPTNAELENGANWTRITTHQVLAEERRLIDFVRDGKGKFKPFGSGTYQFQNEILSPEQRNAVLHVLRSPDWVTAIRGGAGTGKTTMMKEAVAAIEANGQKVFTFAPSAEASRGVLRTDAGFANAETVEALLQNAKLQEQVRGQVLWIDEAGLLGARTLARIATLAEKENCRIILSGDTAQHRAVERGDALRLLEQHAGLEAAELQEIWRQKADSHKAIVASLRAGDLERAFKGMEKLGMVRELAPETRHETLAADYVAAVADGKTALVISPTHSEGERVTDRIRERLKASGRLSRNEREFVQLKNLQWTEAQRGDARNYQPGMMVQFHQNVPGFRRGERVKVKQRDVHGILVERANGKSASLTLDTAARFQVYEARTIGLSPGDRVRITQNGFTRDGQRLNNGDLKQVTGFTKGGDLKLANGWVLPKDYGNLTHGYCVTSYASQSKGVDRVFIAESSESFRAADRQQFYVSVSRFKEALTIYTDDKRQLLEAVSKSSVRPLATDLLISNPSRAALRVTRPMRRVRPTRPTRLSPVQRIARFVEDARHRFSGVFQSGQRIEVGVEKAEATQTAEPVKPEEITPDTIRPLPPRELLAPKQAVRPPESQRPSRGIRI